jgi:hypothetical protein
MLLLDRYLGFHFFTVDGGGNPVMYVNLIWAWGHPEVCILILPAFGIFSEVISTFAGKPFVRLPFDDHRHHDDLLFGAFAGYTYWFPKAFGFRLDERLGKAAFWFWVIGFYVAFMPLYGLGLEGMTRRMQHYDVADFSVRLRLLSRLLGAMLPRTISRRAKSKSSTMPGAPHATRSSRCGRMAQLARDRWPRRIAKAMAVTRGHRRSAPSQVTGFGYSCSPTLLCSQASTRPMPSFRTRRPAVLVQERSLISKQSRSKPFSCFYPVSRAGSRRWPPTRATCCERNWRLLRPVFWVQAFSLLNCPSSPEC